MQSLLGRTLVVVAHPDDEAGGCGALLQRISYPIILFATDGAPFDHWFWSSFDSRSSYAAARRIEALAAARQVNAEQVEFVSDEYPTCTDQRLFQALPLALQVVGRAALKYRPDALLTVAYEGGHPDHDACSFISHIIGSRFRIPVWEMPLYHRVKSGELVVQRFLRSNGTEVTLIPTADESGRKQAMLGVYKSQAGLQNFVKKRTECFRPQADYDYTQPPHPGMLNYEAWQWPVSGKQVCAAFSDCLAQIRKPRSAEPEGSPGMKQPDESARQPIQLPGQ
jgi:LmbE family N-acetylglucosaminyl deacetylase